MLINASCKLISRLVTKTETVLFDTGNITKDMWTEQSQYDRCIYSTATTATQRTNIKKYKGYGRLYIRFLMISSVVNVMHVPCILTDDIFQANSTGSMLASYAMGASGVMWMQVSMNDNAPSVHTVFTGSGRVDINSITYRWKLIGID